MKTKKQLKSIIEDLNAIIDEKNLTINRLIKEKLSATDQYYASLKDQDAIREELFTLRQERLNLNIKSLEEGLKQHDLDFKKGLVNLAKDFTAAGDEHVKINTSIADLKETLNSFINNQNTENMFNLKKLREKEAEIAKLTAEKKELQASNKSLSDQLTQSQTDVATLRDRLDKLGYAENQLEKLREQLRKKESEVADLQSSNGDLTAEVEDYKHKLQSANGKQGTMSAKIKKLEAQVEALSKPAEPTDGTNGDPE